MEAELEGKPRFSGQFGASHNVDVPPSPDEARSGPGIVGTTLGIHLPVKSTFGGVLLCCIPNKLGFFTLQPGLLLQLTVISPLTFAISQFDFAIS